MTAIDGRSSASLLFRPKADPGSPPFAAGPVGGQLALTTEVTLSLAAVDAAADAVRPPMIDGRSVPVVTPAPNAVVPDGWLDGVSDDS